MSAASRSEEFAADQHWQCIDFISDLHLASDTPRSFEAWACYLLHTPADAVFMLGDLFEVWVGDDARDSGFERDCVRVLRRASSARTLAFMVGNRDFLVGDATLQDAGVIGLSDPTVLLAFGQRALLTHGDALCIADTEYQHFRTEVRSQDWRTRFLGRPLAERRRIARSLRDASEARKRKTPAHEWADIDVATALQWQQAANAPTLIHGHTHRPGSEQLAPGYHRHVLSDWDLDHGTRAQVLRLTTAGFLRVAPEGEVQC